MASSSYVNWRVKLKEYADINRFTLEYSENGTSGPPHEPTFSFKVQMLCNNDRIEATGSGKQKKVAKEQAARALLGLIMQPDKTSSKSDIPTSESQTQSGDENGGRNFIGELQELCQKNKWPLPSYNAQKNGCLYVCYCSVTVSVQKYEGQVAIHMKGSETSKKSAKITAAKRALHLAQLCVDITEAAPGANQV